MAYIDGFVLPVFSGKRDAYKVTATAAAPAPAWVAAE